MYTDAISVRSFAIAVAHMRHKNNRTSRMAILAAIARYG
jgi:hypothetical protein